jgi:hypothetical protein
VLRWTASGVLAVGRPLVPVTIPRPGRLGRVKFARRNMRIERKGSG